eukprot:EG_transcript_3440
MSVDRLSLKSNPLDPPLPAGRPGREDTVVSSLAESFTEPTCNSVSQFSSAASTPPCFTFRLSSGTLQEEDPSAMSPPEVDHLKTIVRKKELEIGQLLSHARAMEATIMDQKVRLQVQERQMTSQRMELAAYRARTLPAALGSPSPPAEGPGPGPSPRGPGADLATREADARAILEAWWRGGWGALAGQHLDALAASPTLGPEYVTASERRARQAEEAECALLSQRWALQAAELAHRCRLAARHEEFFAQARAETDRLLQGHRRWVEAFELLEAEELVFRAATYALSDSILSRLTAQERAVRQGPSRPGPDHLSWIVAFLLGRQQPIPPLLLPWPPARPAAPVPPLGRLQREEAAARQALALGHGRWAAARAVEAQELAARVRLEGQHDAFFAQTLRETRLQLAQHRRWEEALELLEAEELVFRASIYALQDAVLRTGRLALGREELRGRCAVLAEWRAMGRQLERQHRDLQVLWKAHREARWVERFELLEAEELVFRAALWSLAEAVLQGGRVGVLRRELAGRQALHTEWRKGLDPLHQERQLVVRQLWRERWALLANDELVMRVATMSLWQQLAMLRWADFRRGLETVLGRPAGAKSPACSSHHGAADLGCPGRPWLDQIPDVPFPDDARQDSMAAYFQSVMSDAGLTPHGLCHGERCSAGSSAETLRYRCLRCQQDWCRDCVDHLLPEYALADGTLAFLCDHCL